MKVGDRVRIKVIHLEAGETIDSNVKIGDVGTIKSIEEEFGIAYVELDKDGIERFFTMYEEL